MDENYQQNLLFRTFCTFKTFWLFWPEDASSFITKFYIAQLLLRIQLVANFRKKVMNGYRAIGRTDSHIREQTDATENNSPSLNKRMQK